MAHILLHYEKTGAFLREFCYFIAAKSEQKYRKFYSVIRENRRHNFTSDIDSLAYV